MTNPARRQIVRNLRLREISSVDRPAQVGATVMLMKRADGLDTDIRKNAADVATGLDPSFDVASFEDAMLRRADELAASQRITPEQALARNLSTDRILKDLAHASTVARTLAYGAEVRKRYSAGST